MRKIRLLALILVMVMVVAILASCNKKEEEPAPEAVETVEEVVVVETAPQTFDMGITAAIAAAVSAFGYMLSKKR